MKGMQKIRRGTGFLGVLNYALEGGRGRIIGGNMSGTSPKALAREFGAARRMRSDIERPVWHNSLRLKQGEHVSPETLAEIAADYMRRMKWSPLHPWVAIMHDDPEGQHVHIIACRVALDGTVFLGRNENLISTKVIASLERDHGLAITKGADYDPETGKVIMPNVRRPSPGEENKAREWTGVTPPRVELQGIVREAMRGKPTTAEFIDRLHAAGVTVGANVATTGRVNGLSFVLDADPNRIPWAASKLGAMFAWAKLSKEIDYVQERDHEILANLGRDQAGRRADQDNRRDAGPADRTDGQGDGGPRGGDTNRPGRNAESLQGSSEGVGRPSNGGSRSDPRSLEQVSQPDSRSEGKAVGDDYGYAGGHGRTEEGGKGHDMAPVGSAGHGGGHHSGSALERIAALDPRRRVHQPEDGRDMGQGLGTPSQRKEQRRAELEERRWRDLATHMAAEHDDLLRHKTRLLIRPSRWEEWIDWRRATLVEAYGQSLDRIAHQWRIEKATDTQLVFKDREGRAVHDIGHVVTATLADDKEIQLMLDLAELKGWLKIDLLGEESFRLRAAMAALLRGFQLNDPELEMQAKEALDAWHQVPEASSQDSIFPEPRD